MYIKYLNVCLDKEQFVEKIVDKTMPRMAFKDAKVIPDRNVKVLFVISFGMLLFNIVNMLCGGSGSMFLDVFLTVFWAYKCLETYCHYKHNEQVKIENKIGNSISHVMNECISSAKENVSFDDMVTEPLFGNVDEVCHVLWIIYNTNVVGVKVEDGKIIFYYEYEGERLFYKLDKFFDKGLTEYNTVSVTKDGVFLGMNNDVLKHAIKSIVLQQCIARNKENET